MRDEGSHVALSPFFGGCPGLPGRTPLNVTRRLEMKFSLPVTPDIENITVKGRLNDRQGSQLIFSAEVRDPQGEFLAKARATHWIVEGLIQDRD